MKSFIKFIPVMLDSFFLLVTSHLFAWSTINGVAICTTNNNHEYPVIVSDESGGAVISWLDGRNGSIFGIYAQRINSKGTTLWTTNGVPICPSIYGQGNPISISDGSGGAIITWMDTRNGSTYNIYAERVNSSGIIIWTTNGVPICTVPNHQKFPKIVSNGSGGAIITWEDWRSGNGYSDIYAQEVNSDGSTLWTNNGIAICTAISNQGSPFIVSDGSNGAIITWVDSRNENSDIYAQRVNSKGITLWPTNGVPINTNGNSQGNPTIVSDGSNGAIITWMDSRNGNYDIYAQRVNSNGITLWTTNGVPICTADNDQQNPMIVSDGSGGAIITWMDNRRVNGYTDIYAQRINSNGSTLWINNGVVICATDQQSFPLIVSDGLDGAIITWLDGRNGNSDIYAQRINSNGSTFWTTNGVPICTAANGQFNSSIVSDGSSGVIVTWQDSRSGNYTIYAQQIDSYGLMILPTLIPKQVWELFGDK